MTAQVREIIVYEEQEYRMEEYPLADHIRKMGNEINYDNMTSACWRGYIGDWEIILNKLYLTGLSNMTGSGYKFSMKTLFPGQEKVFAEWYSGELRIPRGEMIENNYRKHIYVYEEDLFLEIENGILINSRIINNTEKKERTESNFKTDKEQQN